MSLPKEFEGPANLARTGSRRSLNWSKKQWKWAKKQQGKNNKVIKPYVDNMMNLMGDMSANYAEDRADYEGIFKPLRDEYIGQINDYQGKADAFSGEVAKLKQDALDYGSQANKSFLMGRAIENVSGMFEDARQKNLSALEKFGINPSATRYAALDYGVRMQEALAQAAAGTQAGLNADETSRAMFSDALDRELQARGLDKGVLDMKKGMLDFGENMNKTAIAEAGAGAEIGGAGVNAKLAGSELAGRQRESTTSFLNSTANMIGNWSQTLASGYDAAAKEKELEQQASSGIGSAVGGILGVARSFFAQEGGEVPHELSPSGGAIPDDVPTQTSPGEFFFPKYASDFYGKDRLNKMLIKARQGMGIAEDVA